MTNYDKIYEKAVHDIIDIISNENEANMMSIYNQFCEKRYYMDDMIFNMYEINDFVFCSTVEEFFNKFDLDNFSPYHNYFIDSIYGIRSFDDVYEYIKSDIETIARWIMKERENCDNCLINDVIEAWDEFEVEYEGEEE